jgi:hypothetical protein
MKQEMEKNINQKKGKFIFKLSFAIIIGLIVAGSIFSAVYFYRQYKLASQKTTAEEPQKDELTMLTDEIKRIIDLPDEKPTLATVTDVEQAKKKPFFAKSQNGDKVLIYMNAKKAILYRPIEKKIIEIANVSGLDNSSQENKESDLPEPMRNDAAGQVAEEIGDKITTPIIIALYDGTKIENLESNVAEKISSIAGIEIGEKKDAEKIYLKTIVADLTGGHEELTNKIIQTIGGEIGKIPDGESKPNADILVIVGKE